jgi:hypothetical protein
MEDQMQRRVTLSLMTIQAKAESLYADIKGKRQDAPQTFVASNGWCSLFKNRAGFHNVKVSGEAASGNTKAAQMFPDVFKEIINEGGYTAQQVFNVDETGLFWKKMPERTYISKEEKIIQGSKLRNIDSLFYWVVMRLVILGLNHCLFAIVKIHVPLMVSVRQLFPFIIVQIKKLGLLFLFLKTGSLIVSSLRSRNIVEKITFLEEFCLFLIMPLAILRVWMIFIPTSKSSSCHPTRLRSSGQWIRG